jgi:hypothetical protein
VRAPHARSEPAGAQGVPSDATARARLSLPPALPFWVWVGIFRCGHPCALCRTGSEGSAVLVPRVSEFPPLPALCLCVVFLGCGALAILRIDKGIFRCGHPCALYLNSRRGTPGDGQPDRNASVPHTPHDHTSS